MAYACQHRTLKPLENSYIIISDEGTYILSGPQCINPSVTMRQCRLPACHGRRENSTVAFLDGNYRQKLGQASISPAMFYP